MTEDAKPRSRLTRWVLVAFVVVLIAAVGTMILALRAQEAPVSRANYARILPGMTQTELVELLGGPPIVTLSQHGRVDSSGVYVTNDSLAPARAAALGYQPCTYQQWESPEIRISVISDATGHVVHTYSGGGDDDHLLKRITDMLTRDYLR